MFLFSILDGSLFINSSSLGGRYWSGQLEKFSSFSSLKEQETCEVFQQFAVGVADFECIETSDERVICGFDTGAVQVLLANKTEFESHGSAIEHDSYVTSVSVFSDQISAVSGSADCWLAFFKLLVQY